MKKQVIVDTESEIIDYRKVTDEVFYGIQNGVSGDKGVLFKNKIGLYTFLYLVGVLNENIRHSFCLLGGSYNLCSYIKEVINKGFKVYQFDSEQELAAWLAEE